MGGRKEAFGFNNFMGSSLRVWNDSQVTKKAVKKARVKFSRAVARKIIQQEVA